MSYNNTNISTCLACNESDLHHRIITCTTASANTTSCTEIVSQNINTGIYCMPCTVHSPTSTYPPSYPPTSSYDYSSVSASSYPQSDINTDAQYYPHHQPVYQPSYYLPNGIPVARAVHNAKQAQDFNWPKAQLDPQPLLDGSLDGVSAPPPLVGGNEEPCGGCGGRNWEFKSCGLGGCGGWVRSCGGCGGSGGSGCGHY